MGWSLEDRLALLAGQASARDVYHGLEWLRPPVVATEPSRERLRAWVLGGGLTRPKPDTTTIEFLGDDVEIKVAAILALEAMAPPARDYILENVLVVGISVSSGWMAPLTRRAQSRKLITVLSYGCKENDPARTFRARRIALHEFAHCWLESNKSDETPAHNPHLDRTKEPGKEYARWQRPIELRAWTLTELWEGEPLGSDTWMSIRRMMS